MRFLCIGLNYVIIVEADPSMKVIIDEDKTCSILSASVSCVCLTCFCLNSCIYSCTSFSSLSFFFAFLCFKFTFKFEGENCAINRKDKYGLTCQSCYE